MFSRSRRRGRGYDKGCGGGWRSSCDANGAARVTLGVRHVTPNNGQPQGITATLTHSFWVDAGAHIAPGGAWLWAEHLQPGDDSGGDRIHGHDPFRTGVRLHSKCADSTPTSALIRTLFARLFAQ